MSSKRSTTRSLPLSVYLVIAVAALIGTGGGWAWYVTYPPERMVALIVGIVAVVVVAAALLANRRAWQIIMNLAPTALLLAILPFVTKQLGAQTTIVVLVAITTPWLVGTAMLPAFRPVARLTGTDKQAKQDFVREFCRGWLLMLVGGDFFAPSSYLWLVCRQHWPLYCWRHEQCVFPALPHTHHGGPQGSGRGRLGCLRGGVLLPPWILVPGPPRRRSAANPLPWEGAAWFIPGSHHGPANPTGQGRVRGAYWWGAVDG